MLEVTAGLYHVAYLECFRLNLKQNKKTPKQKVFLQMEMWLTFYCYKLPPSNWEIDLTLSYIKFFNLCTNAQITSEMGICKEFVLFEFD